MLNIRLITENCKVQLIVFCDYFVKVYNYNVFNFLLPFIIIIKFFNILLHTVYFQSGWKCAVYLLPTAYDVAIAVMEKKGNRRNLFHVEGDC
jgi:hypothetical protein